MVFLVPGVQQDDSDIDRGVLFHILFHYSLLQDTEYSSLCCTTSLFIYFLCFFNNFIYLFWALLGLSCYACPSLAVESRGYSLVAVHRLPIVM